ncbi:MAG: hypothetical protein IPJ34_26855 [Myxococcales bacterium]|nr:hypothetical protein [Myxococcales bacterium]
MRTLTGWAMVIAVAAAGCGSESGGAATADTGAADVTADADAATDSAPAACKKLVVKNLIRDPEFGKPGENYSALVGVPEPALGTGVADEFQIQLYEFTSKQAPGTFDLGAGKETNFSTCSHCVAVFEDMNAEGVAARYFFQESGTLVLTVNPTPTTGEVKGRLEKVKLVEVTIDYAGKTYKSTPVPGGACLEIEAFDIDTTAPADAGVDAAG